MPLTNEPWVTTLLCFLPAAWYCVYSSTSIYQKPTPALALDTVAFVGLFGALFAAAGATGVVWLQLVVALALCLFNSAFFCGNKACLRFFDDWVHHQMFFEIGAGVPIAHDVIKSLKAWDWIGGVAVPLGMGVAFALHRHDERAVMIVPASLGVALAAFVLHAFVRARDFSFNEHNPFMNVLREALRELKGARVARLGSIRPRELFPIAQGFRADDVPEFPLIQSPLPGGADKAENADAIAGIDRVALAAARPNIVLVLMETVRALECGCHGAPVSFTPNLDRLARDGIVIQNFYANGSQTVRGEMSLLCSYYDHFGGSPLYVRYGTMRLRTLPEILGLHGYKTLWISSYTASFHNKRRFLTRHGMQEIHDDKGLNYSGPKVNWGPPDEDLFRYATGILDRQPRPFFAEVMTLTNHWPFEGPYTTAERTPRVSKDKLYTDFTRGVFYTDHAIGTFMDSVRDKPWFDNTIFVFTGDHGAWLFPNDGNHTLLQRQEAYFRMPMVMYAPKLLKPGVIRRVGSQIDFAPTMLDMLRIRERNSFAGRSLLDDTPDEQRKALMLHWHTWNLRVGNRYLYNTGKSFQESRFDCSRAQDQPEGGKSSFACFRDDQDILFNPPDAQGRTLHVLPASEQQTLYNHADETLFLVDYLKRRNLVYRD